MDVSNLPLLELFTKLRDAGLPLGIDEYKLVLKSLQGGFGIRDKAALKGLCQSLWVKSNEEKRIFEYYFKELIVEDVDEKNISLETPNNKYQRREVKIIRKIVFGTCLVGIVLGITASVKESTQIKKPITPIPTPTSTPSQIPQQTQLQNNQNQVQQNWILLILLFIIVSTSSYWLLRWLIPRLTKQKFTEIKTNSQLDSISKSWFSGKSTRGVVENVNIDIPFQPTTNNVMPNHDFLLTKNYLPITQRQMKQIWRHFRRMVREGTPTDLDITATVNDIGRKGLLLKPILIPRRVNKSELILLIDQDGSMVPFSKLSHQLIETAIRGGRLGNSGAYYFHNCPTEYLYHDPNHQQAELINNVLNSVSDRTAILIFSDAGAARGGYNEERCKLTEEFITKIKQRVRYIAWLNPVPRKRWLGTTACEIANLVPMFEFNRQELLDTINVLRGRAVNLEGYKI